jgi:hypothetical protein
VLTRDSFFSSQIQHPSHHLRSNEQQPLDALFTSTLRLFLHRLLSLFTETYSTMADWMFYMKKNKEKEAIKAKEREEKEQLKNVLITDTVETDIRCVDKG